MRTHGDLSHVVTVTKQMHCLASRRPSWGPGSRPPASQPRSRCFSQVLGDTQPLSSGTSGSSGQRSTHTRQEGKERGLHCSRLGAKSLVNITLSLTTTESRGQNVAFAVNSAAERHSLFQSAVLPSPTTVLGAGPPSRGSYAARGQEGATHARGSRAAAAHSEKPHSWCRPQHVTSDGHASCAPCPATPSATRRLGSDARGLAAFVGNWLIRGRDKSITESLGISLGSRICLTSMPIYFSPSEGLGLGVTVAFLSCQRWTPLQRPGSAGGLFSCRRCRPLNQSPASPTSVAAPLQVLGTLLRGQLIPLRLQAAPQAGGLSSANRVS